MIWVNTILNNNTWRLYIKNPNNFIKSKVNYLNKRFIKLKKKKIICTLMLSGSSEIKKLNFKFRKKNKTTDVLSFPFHSKKDLEEKLKREKEIYIGDIIINLNKIKNKKNKVLFEKEFDELWVHGLAHLFGYDHKKLKDFEDMKRFEKKILSYLK